MMRNASAAGGGGGGGVGGVGGVGIGGNSSGESVSVSPPNLVPVSPKSAQERPQQVPPPRLGAAVPLGAGSGHARHDPHARENMRENGQVSPGAQEREDGSRGRDRGGGRGRERSVGGSSRLEARRAGVGVAGVSGDGKDVLGANGSGGAVGGGGEAGKVNVGVVKPLSLSSVLDRGKAILDDFDQVCVCVYIMLCNIYM